jgi:hypothetical protein
VKAAIAQTARAHAAAGAKVMPTAVMVMLEMVPQLQNLARAGVRMGSAAAQRAAVTAVAQQVNRAAAQTALATVRTARVTVLPATRRLVVVAAHRARAHKVTRLNPRAKVRSVAADQNAAHVPPENPAVVAVRTPKSEPTFE